MTVTSPIAVLTAAVVVETSYSADRRYFDLRWIGNHAQHLAIAAPLLPLVAVVLPPGFATADSIATDRPGNGNVALVTNDFQLDVFTQHGLSQAAPGFQLSLGACARL